MENANLTKAQDLGAATELLSGDFYVPFGRSTSHQLWSSAMVITPILRGLFGISVDAETKTITVNPHLPAGWDHAEVSDLPLPEGPESLHFSKSGDSVVVELDSIHHKMGTWTVRSDVPGSKSGDTENGSEGVRVPLAPVEISESISMPLPGARTSQVRVISEKWGPNGATLVFEGLAGSQTSFGILRHRLLPRLKFDCPENRAISSQDRAHLAEYVAFANTAIRDAKVPLELFLHFPEGEGWKTITVTVTW
jgi:hypothetical protein